MRVGDVGMLRDSDCVGTVCSSIMSDGPLGQLLHDGLQGTGSCRASSSSDLHTLFCAGRCLIQP